MSLDLSSDYLIFDRPRPAIWTQAGLGVSGQVDHAIRREIRNEVVPTTDGTARNGDVEWSLPVVELPQRPGAGDTIQDVGDGRTWTILKVWESTLNTRWKCFGRDNILAYNLTSTLVIEYAIEVKRPNGEMDKVWAVLDTQAGRVQTTDTTVSDQHGQYNTAKAYEIYLSRNVKPKRFMRVRDPAGVVYNVSRWENEGSIEKLMILSADYATWPSA